MDRAEFTPPLPWLKAQGHGCLGDALRRSADSASGRQPSRGVCAFSARWRLTAWMLLWSWCSFAGAVDKWRGPPHYSTVVQDCWKLELRATVADDAANLSTVNVVYSSDRRYFSGLLSSMVSLAKHLESPRRCRIHLLIATEHMEEAHRLISCFRSEMRMMSGIPTVIVHELRKSQVNITGLRSKNPFRMNLMKPETMARIYLHEYLRHSPRAIWMDTDTMVKADVAKLYTMRMRHALAAVWLTGVNSHLRSQVAVNHPLIRDLVKYPDIYPAFNTGVLVYDLAKWRSGELTRSLEYWITTQDGARIFKEGLLQGPMNLVFCDRFDRIDWRWNVYGLGFWAYPLPADCVNQARILHWTGAAKPWQQDGFHKELFKFARECATD